MCTFHRILLGRSNQGTKHHISLIHRSCATQTSDGIRMYKIEGETQE